MHNSEIQRSRARSVPFVHQRAPASPLNPSAHSKTPANYAAGNAKRKTLAAYEDSRQRASLIVYALTFASYWSLLHSKTETLRGGARNSLAPAGIMSTSSASSVDSTSFQCTGSSVEGRVKVTPSW